MKAIIFICQFFFIIRTDAQIPTQCVGSDNRPPQNSDIMVTCGTQSMDLSILLCPIYYANYNESLMILNGQSNPECKGTADFTVTPPKLNFRFSLNRASLSSCNNVFQITNEVGTGQFSQFSNVQYVNISGIVVSFDPATGLITYRPSITYLYSCKYPLLYVLNNTQLAVGGVSLAINNNNGSFISTLKMQLYADTNHTTLLNIPATGLNLKTQINVLVSATNLSDRFNVLLDRCFASVSLYIDDTTPGYDLFVGCSKDPQTSITENGINQTAAFSFEAFRFLEHKNLSVSVFYVHCITRLCNVSTCSSMLPVCPASRRRRDTSDATDSSSTTVTSQPIIVSNQPDAAAPSASIQTKDIVTQEYSGPVVAVIVCVAVLSILLVGMGVYFSWNLRHKLKL